MPITIVQETPDTFRLSDGRQVAKNGLSMEQQDRMRQAAAAAVPAIPTPSIPTPDIPTPGIQPTAVGGGFMGAATALAPAMIGSEGSAGAQGSSGAGGVSGAGGMSGTAPVQEPVPQAQPGYVPQYDMQQDFAQPQQQPPLRDPGEGAANIGLVESGVKTETPVQTGSGFEQFEQQRQELDKLLRSGPRMIPAPKEEQPWVLPSKPTAAEPVEPSVPPVEEFTNFGEEKLAEMSALEQAINTGQETSEAAVGRLKELKMDFTAAGEKRDTFVKSIEPQMQQFKQDHAVWKKDLDDWEAMYESERMKYKTQTMPGIKNEIAGLNQQYVDMQNNQTKLLKETYKNIDTERQAIREMKVDPDRVWSGDKGFKAAILMTLGASMTAFGASVTGRGDPNAGVKAMHKFIDRDIGLQQQAIQNKRAGVKDMMTGLEMKMNIFGSEKAGIQAQKASMIEAMNIKLREMEMRTRDVNAQNALRQQRFNNKLAVKRLDMEILKNESIHQNNLTRTIMQERVARMKALKDIKGKPVTGTSTKDLAGLISSLKGLDKLEQQWEKASGGWDSSTIFGWLIPDSEIKKYDTMVGHHVAKLLKARSGTAVSAPERERTESLYPGTFTVESTGRTKLQVLREDILSDIEERLKAESAAGRDTTVFEKNLRDYQSGKGTPTQSSIPID